MGSKDVLLLENELSFSSLTNENLMIICKSITKRVLKENLKNIRVRAVLNGDIVFQYLMDGKVGDIWLNRKQKTVEHFGHSSYYIFKLNEETGQYDEYKENDEYAICGGGFPLIVQDKIVGSIIVSGLEHDRDHQLIVDAIRNFKNKIAFASDVDGTLMFHDREDNYKSQDLIKIRTFQEEGNYFGICTGRPMCFIGDMINLGLDFYIMSSGAVMLDKNLKIIKDYPIDHTSVQHIFEDYKESACLIIQTGNLKTSYGNKVLNPEVDFIKIDSVDEIKEETFYGISIIVDNEEMASIIANDINSQYKDLIGYQNINSVDIVHRGCSKGEAIKQIKGLLNVNKIVAIGDSFNDISMLKESDISFTFHNSANEVKEHADEIVDSIAEAIMKLSR